MQKGPDCGPFVSIALPFPNPLVFGGADADRANTVAVVLSTALAKVGFALQTGAQYMKRLHAVNGTAAPADTGRTR